MSLQEFFCSPSSKRTATVDLETSIFECDYDSDVTNLYQAIEGEAWVPVLQYLETGKWEHMYGKDPQSPERQSRTWVTRFEPDGTVRWSQLPLHAAIIFGAPKKIITSLINLYPAGVRCTDDQQMLPLHLAFRFGAEDSVIALVLERFPEAFFTKNVRGRIPTDVEGPRMELISMMNQVIRLTTEHATSKHHSKLYKQKIADLNDDLNLQTRLNASLESDKTKLEERLSRTTAELAILKNEYKLLREQKVEMSDTPMLTPQIKSLTFKGQTSRPTAGTFKGHESTMEPLLSKQERHRETELGPRGAGENSGTATTRASTQSFVFGRKTESKKYETSVGADTRIDFETRRSVDGNADSKRNGAALVKTASDRYKKRGHAYDPPKFADASTSEGSADTRNAKPLSEFGLKVPVERAGRSSPLQNFKKEQSWLLKDGTDDVASYPVATFRTNERRSSNGGSDISKKLSYAGPAEKMGAIRVEPHPGNRPRLPRHGFFQGFDTAE